MKTPYDNYRLKITDIMTQIGEALSHLHDAKINEQFRDSEIDDLKDAAASLRTCSTLANALANQIIHPSA